MCRELLLHVHPFAATAARYSWLNAALQETVTINRFILHHKPSFLGGAVKSDLELSRRLLSVCCVNILSTILLRDMKRKTIRCKDAFQ